RAHAMEIGRDARLVLESGGVEMVTVCRWCRLIRLAEAFEICVLQSQWPENSRLHKICQGRSGGVLYRQSQQSIIGVRIAVGRAGWEKRRLVLDVGERVGGGP